MCCDCTLQCTRTQTRPRGATRNVQCKDCGSPLYPDRRSRSEVPIPSYGRCTEGDYRHSSQQLRQAGTPKPTHTTPQIRDAS